VIKRDLTKHPQFSTLALSGAEKVPGLRGNAETNIMKRLFAILILFGCALAQEPRDAYREAYRNWRAADPRLEADGATDGAALGIRADKVSGQASLYVGARKQFLESLHNAAQEKARSLEPLPVTPGKTDLLSRTEANVSTETTAGSSSIAAIGNDPDRGLQRLRRSFEEERAALLALSNAMAVRRGALAGVSQTAEAAELARSRVVENYQTIATRLEQATRQTDKQALDWAAYYKLLADGARGVVPPRVGPSSVSSSGIAPTGVAPTGAAPTGVAPSGVAPSGTPAQTSIQTRGTTPAPLRYVGEWNYPKLHPLYSGPEPQLVELAVHEDNGRATGTFTVRFKFPASSALDPLLHGDFEGTFQSAPTQAFSVVTSDGGKGTIELIPGSAFNLLEVNLTMEPRPGKVPHANFVLVKK
jgi:hypothetical protein